jgi:hypothetical protein
MSNMRVIIVIGAAVLLTGCVPLLGINSSALLAVYTMSAMSVLCNWAEEYQAHRIARKAIQLKQSLMLHDAARVGMPISTTGVTANNIVTTYRV